MDCLSSGYEPEETVPQRQFGEPRRASINPGDSWRGGLTGLWVALERRRPVVAGARTGRCTTPFAIEI